MAGPIGVAQMAGSVAQEGMIPFLTFIAFLSLNLGILNLIPIPALDGGQFLILAVEGILRHPLPPKAKERVQLVGIALILGLTIYGKKKNEGSTGRFCHHWRRPSRRSPIHDQYKDGRRGSHPCPDP